MNLKRLFTCYFLLSVLEAIAAVVWLGLMPAEAGNALVFGYSLQRLILMGGMVLLGLICLIPVYLIRKKRSTMPRLESFFDKELVGLSSGLIVLITWVLCFLPAYQWGRFAGYKDRLLPLLLWFLLTGVQSCLLALIQRKKKIPGSFWRGLNSQPALKKSWVITLIIFAFGTLLVAFFRIGILPDIVYWNDANVPLLGIQIIGIVFGSILFFGVLSHFGFFSVKAKDGLKAVLPDVVICILLWSLAVVCWTQVSMPRSFFSPGPYPPNNEIYPFSDAARYDTSAQYALIGEGLGTNEYVDKPLYVAFLTFIHLLVGNRTESVVGLQVAIIALIPVLIYLIGRKIQNRLGGLMAAAFFIFREINNIQGTLWVLSTNSRVLMSESLVTLLLIIFVLMFIGWVRDTRSRIQLMAAGGALGLAGLVRLNPLLLMPVVFIVIWLVCWKNWRQGFINSLIFVCMFLATIFPWMLQSYLVHDNFLYFKSTMHGVVLDQRTYYSLNKPAVAATPVDQAAPKEPVVEKPVNKTWFRITGVSQYVSAHFFHNMISAAAIFPTSLTLDSLEKTMKAPQSYWDADWTGEMSAGQMIMVSLALILISLGIASGWSRSRWAGLVPAGFLIAYSLATSAARTSAGRYILPADWVFLLYFALGISQFVQWIQDWLKTDNLAPVIESWKEKPISSNPVWQLCAVAGLFVFLGSTPILFDRVFPRQYPSVEKTVLVNEMAGQGIIDSLGISKSELHTFLQSPNSVVYKGRGLYPRYYAQDTGEPDRFSATRIQSFPRLVLDVINQNGSVSGVLPLVQAPDVLLNGSEVLAIGCKGELNDDWLALVISGADRRMFLRTPTTEWSCPLILPVCDDNRVCR